MLGRIGLFFGLCVIFTELVTTTEICTGNSNCSKKVRWIDTAKNSTWSTWTPWSSCSASCGTGTRTRWRFCLRQIIQPCQGISRQEKECYDFVCPSYLSWPRIHFSGTLNADCPTVNNQRCLYNNSWFCPTCNTFRQNMISLVQTKGHSEEKIVYLQNEVNPMGNGHFYFSNTVITSACWNPGEECDEKDFLVNRRVTYVAPGRMVDLDPDWQTAPEVIGYEIKIPGMMIAMMENGPSSQITKRISNNINDHATAATIKSKLVKIRWLDDFYRKKFMNATSLSISFVMDMFSFKTDRGRITGTIGMTSDDDPTNLYGGRVMRPLNLKRSPSREYAFALDIKTKAILIDCGTSIRSDTNGNFAINDLKHVDVVAYDPEHKLCRHRSFNCRQRAVHCGGKDLFMVSSGGALDFVQQGQNWYLKRGGVVLVSLKHFSKEVIDVLSRTRLGLVNHTVLYNHCQSNRWEYKLCDLFPAYCRKVDAARKGSCMLMSLEDEYGLNFKTMGGFTKRISRGETWKVPAIVTSFSRPVKNATLSLHIVDTPFELDSCTFTEDPIAMYLAHPKNAVKLSDPATTNRKGTAILTVKAVRNPGNPRKAGVDGQVYPLGLTVTYAPDGKKPIRIADGGAMDGCTLTTGSYSKAIKECSLTASRYTFNFAVRVFSSLPAVTMRKTCPTWTEDIRPIFQLYYNLFPVMEKHNIINLRDIHDVRSQLHKINMSMFEFDWNHPNFMPTTRDLSPDKTEIVRRWLECEITGGPTDKQYNVYNEGRYRVCGSEEYLTRTVTHLKEILQMAIFVELYTIPPYMTAMFSLKRERFKEAYSILKGIATEEMLHMTLDANILNAIGGSPNTTDPHWLPNYPTPFPSLEFMQLLPNVMLKLEKFSLSMVKEVFSEIEKPASLEVFKIFHSASLLWSDLPDDDGGRWKLNNTTNILYDTSAKMNSTGPRWLKAAQTLNATRMVDKTVNGPLFWKDIFEKTTDMLELPEIADVYTIGAYYAHVLLKLLQAESCVKMGSIKNTIFVGDPNKQLTSKQWYVTKGLSTATLFPVTGLKSAIEAILEVVYEGEGGSPCWPFVSDNPGDHRQRQLNLGGRQISSRREEYSHYIRFQEIVHGRELVEVTEVQPQWASDQCLHLNNEFCGLPSKNFNHSYHPHFCYTGRSLSISEKDDVWQLKINKFSRYNKKKPPHSFHKVKTFNMLYTSLLRCLEIAFNGNPTGMSKCMGNMYELLEAGRKLATLPFYKNGDSETGPNTMPEWKFIKDGYEQKTKKNYAQLDFKFC
uniref:uncharacterized protein LOC113474058 isoform X2 n=1 Tax=Ciona intestinalis TaxID=7719 RepID=UPI000EF4CC5C|nr:uncharacterized protein LOC113474058 isoform X2 [Ciona intestinalis]|eukprot:XP_026689571.1 uncharacterized protein LOC113474058 isoform X2 [Ciona intestinalis]